VVKKKPFNSDYLNVGLQIFLHILSKCSILTVNLRGLEPPIYRLEDLGVVVNPFKS
jgi:hypothetical protein